MSKRTNRSRSALGTVFGLCALPCRFFAGFATGLSVPLIAIAALVAGIRLLTGRFPFLAHVELDEGGERKLTLKLVPPEQVGDLWAEHKQSYGDQLAKLRAELQSMAQEARSK